MTTLQKVENQPDIKKIQEDINTWLGDKDVYNSLLKTTFNGLDAGLMKRAILEGVLRGFKYEDFLEKNIYAVPFRNRKTGVNTYTLVTSISHARKLAMRSGQVGKSEPVFEEDKNGRIISCTVTVKRMVNNYVGDYSAKVYFSEYNTGKNLWRTKPRTMIAKVAEMHALRSACPEEMSLLYIQEEYEQGQKEELNTDTYEELLRKCTTVDDLKNAWKETPAEAKKDEELVKLKDELKKALNEST